MITVFTLAYNEELQLPQLINHYRSKFPDCQIVVYDNMSTDNTVNIAKNNNCTVISYDTNNQIVDSKYLEIKNNCWKTATTDWVLICDVDELVNISQEDLIEEDRKNTSIVRFRGFNMVNMEDNTDVASIKYGVRCAPYDKYYLFNKKFIQEINYTPGSHTANPVGIISYSTKIYDAYHFNFVNLQLSIDKYKQYASRLSPENIEKKWGSHYFFTKEQIKEEFNSLRNRAIKVII